MELFTYGTLKTKIQGDYDITDENFVNETELLGYINEAIDDSETAIHTMHHEDKYFLAPATITFVASTQDYPLPANIYGNKIRNFWYNNGSEKYRIERVKNLDIIPFVSDADLLQYLIINEETTGAPRLRMYPNVSAARAGAFGLMWYIRNMKRMTTSSAASNVCEIPECVNFVYQHVRKNLAKKTRRADLVAAEDNDLKIQYGLMLEALKDMTVDQNNLIPLDLSSYFDQASEDFYT